MLYAFPKCKYSTWLVKRASIISTSACQSVMMFSIYVDLVKCRENLCDIENPHVLKYMIYFLELISHSLEYSLNSKEENEDNYIKSK